jgi:hypothetical protein
VVNGDGAGEGAGGVSQRFAENPFSGPGRLRKRMVRGFWGLTLDLHSGLRGPSRGLGKLDVTSDSPAFGRPKGSANEHDHRFLIWPGPSV